MQELPERLGASRDPVTTGRVALRGRSGREEMHFCEVMRLWGFRFSDAIYFMEGASSVDAIVARPTRRLSSNEEILSPNDKQGSRCKSPPRDHPE